MYEKIYNFLCQREKQKSGSGTGKGTLSLFLFFTPVSGRFTQFCFCFTGFSGILKLEYYGGGYAFPARQRRRHSV